MLVWIEYAFFAQVLDTAMFPVCFLYLVLAPKKFVSFILPIDF